MVKIKIQTINGIFSCPQSQFVTMMRQVFATGTAIYLSPPFIQHSIPSFTQLKSKRQSLQGNCLVTQFHSEKFYRFLHSQLSLAIFLTSIIMDANMKKSSGKTKICFCLHQKVSSYRFQHNFMTLLPRGFLNELRPQMDKIGCLIRVSPFQVARNDFF